MQLAAGDYGSAQIPPTSILSSSTIAELTGPSSATPAHLFLGATNGLLLQDPGVRASNLSILYSGSGEALQVGPEGEADHVAVIATTGGACSFLSSSVTDSLCAAEGIDQTALNTYCYQGTGGSSATLRGVTAVATGVDSVGFDDDPFMCSYDVGVVNSIFTGTRFGMQLDTTSSGSATTVTAQNIDFVGFNRNPAEGDSELTGSGIIQQPPRFMSPSNMNFREKASSPTVDAGVPDPVTDSDVAGDPRVVGAAPDMGAYEKLDRAELGAMTVKGRGLHFIKVSVDVNPERLATNLVLVAVPAHASAHKSAPVPTGSTFGTRTYTIKVAGLRSNTTYQLQVVAHNLAGKSKSAMETAATT